MQPVMYGGGAFLFGFLLVFYGGGQGGMLKEIKMPLKKTHKKIPFGPQPDRSSRGVRVIGAAGRCLDSVAIKNPQRD